MDVQTGTKKEKEMIMVVLLSLFCIRRKGPVYFLQYGNIETNRLFERLIESSLFSKSSKHFTGEIERQSKSTFQAHSRNPKSIPEIDTQNDKIKSMNDGVRLNKCLLGLSRRGADDAISAGRVTIDGQIVTQAGTRVGGNSIVKLDGKVIQVYCNKLSIKICISSKYRYKTGNLGVMQRKLNHLQNWKKDILFT